MGGKRWDGGKGGERKKEKDAAGWGIKLQLVSAWPSWRMENTDIVDEAQGRALIRRVLLCWDAPPQFKCLFSSKKQG